MVQHISKRSVSQNQKQSDAKITERKHNAYWEMFKDALVEPSFPKKNPILYSKKSLFGLK